MNSKKTNQSYDVNLKSFQVFKLIGQGNFGKVFLVKKNGGPDHQTLYAMKCISTHRNSEHQTTLARTEQKVLKCVQYVPFFIQMQYSFKVAKDFYIVLELAQSGDLFERIQQLKQLPVEAVQVCCAEIVLALEYLHEHKIIYRDLKMENILIDKNGHMLLIDFGLAIFVGNDELPFDKCGTVEYMAPEVINANDQSGCGYSYEIDWWSFGVLTYELITGCSPFVSKKKSFLYDTEYRIAFQNPDWNELKKYDDPHLKEFIENLLIKDPKKRLGAGHKGYTQVKNHPFFRKLNWSMVKNKKYKCLEPSKPNAMVEIDSKKTTLLQVPSRRRSQLSDLLDDYNYVAPHLCSDNINESHENEQIDRYIRNQTEVVTSSKIPELKYKWNLLLPSMNARIETDESNFKPILMKLIINGGHINIPAKRKRASTREEKSASDQQLLQSNQLTHNEENNNCRRSGRVRKRPERFAY